MVEDFYNESSYIPFSRVAVQFLIKIIDSPSCFLKPMIRSNISVDTTVKTEILFQFVLTIEPECPGLSIIDFFRKSPLNMRKSNITFDTIINKTIVTETWIPNDDQIGFHIYCAMAIDRFLIGLALLFYIFILQLVNRYNLIYIV